MFAVDSPIQISPSYDARWEVDSCLNASAIKSLSVLHLNVPPVTNIVASAATNGETDATELEQSIAQSSAKCQLISAGRVEELKISEVVAPVDSANDLSSRLEAQSRQLWALMEYLKTYASDFEVLDMLVANNQDPNFDERSRCADGMMFGALARCPMCASGVRYNDGKYWCIGPTRCSYSSFQRESAKEKWKIPKDNNNFFLSKWFEWQQNEKPARVLPPPSSFRCRRRPDKDPPSYLRREWLLELEAAITGLPREDIEKWEEDTVRATGRLCAGTKKKSTFKWNHVYTQANTRRKTLEPPKMIPLTHSLRRILHDASGMHGRGQVLVDEKSIFNASLITDNPRYVSIRSYFYLQVIQDNQQSDDCYLLFTKEKPFKEVAEEKSMRRMSKLDAMHEFKHLFHEMTGNTWEAYEAQESEIKPAKFFPIINSLSKVQPRDGKGEPGAIFLNRVLANGKTFCCHYMCTKISPQLHWIGNSFIQIPLRRAINLSSSTFTIFM